MNAKKLVRVEQHSNAEQPRKQRFKQINPIQKEAILVKIPKLNQEEAQGSELNDQGKRPSNTPAAHQAKAQYK
ncbi:hypothetical protein ACL1CA_13675, partial [Corynebacterium striatum]